MDWVKVAFFVTGAVIYAVYASEDLLRTFAIKRLAKKIGFAYLKKRLPEALSLYGTPFTQRRFTWNVIDGERNRIRVVLFDCQVGEGKEGWRRTVIAVKTGAGSFSADRFNPKLKVESSGGWLILYYPQETKTGLTPVKELRSELIAM